MLLCFLVWSQVCSKVDCERLKRNFGHFLLTCTDHNWTLDEMVEKSQQVILHHFNDHSVCGEWCKYRKPSVSREEEIQRQNRFRQKGGVLWKHIQQIFAELTTKDKMAQCFHCYSCQKNESLNNSMSFLAPKNKTFSLTHSLIDRAHFLVIIDTSSVIMEKLGGMVDVTTKKYLQNCDRRHALITRIQRDPKNIKKRADCQMKNKRKDWTDRKKDEERGYSYATCMAVDSSGNVKVCKHCGQDDHIRMCKKWQKYVEFQAAKEKWSGVLVFFV